VRAEKTLIKDFWAEKIKESKSLILTDYMGLSAQDMTELRELLRRAKGDYQVVRNRVFKLSAKENGIESLDDFLNGPTGVAFFSDDNIVEVAKILKDFAGSHADLPKVKVGLLEGKSVNASEIKQIASLPSREVLIAQVLGAMNGVVSNFVGVLRERVRSIVTVVNAIKEKKEKEN